MRRVLRLASVLLLAASGASAGEVTVAVAANAAEAVEALAADFEQRTGHRVTVTVGSTGKLYAQILHGAPFDVFLAADQERPRLLVEQGLAVEGSRLTYAVGRLVLWSPDAEVDAAHTLRAGSFRRLAIANPDLAPYGAAARDVLSELGLWESLRSKIVVGENVGQSFTMAASGNAELGFVALSSVLSQGGSYWEVPPETYSPIRQDAVLLDRAGGNIAARAFHLFLGSATALATIESFGFIVGRAVGPLDGSQPGFSSGGYNRRRPIHAHARTR
ncbi:MAG: molybdate ABC transporter substrate-binding protein [Holophagales bacterium]|nr:molybdate ABC transporter substrate-binding protein [Holophagales bacterium]MYF06184.1 molybdate ABC transporter substrate-binding protein [Holophagales bacterium]MYJ26971.1 molybdate ABC transporter substrate-binding protein [Holophagales bacterium]